MMNILQSPSLLNPSLPSNNSPTTTTSHDGFNISTTTSRSHTNTNTINSKTNNNTTNSTTNTNNEDPSSSSMTLAISHENAKRMLEASRAFNVSLDRLKEVTKRKELEEESKRRQRKQRDASSIPGVDKVDCGIVKKEEGENSITEDGTNATTRAKSGGNGATTDGVSPPTEEQRIGGSTNADDAPPSNSNTNSDHSSTTNDNDDDTTRKTTSIDKLLVPAALASDNNLLSTYVKQMQTAHAEGTFSMPEIEVCLLLFLDMDKSNKLLSAFELLSKWVVVEDKDDKQRESEGDGVGRDTVMNDLDGDDVKNIMSPHTSLSSPPPSTDGTKSSALQSLDDSTKLKPEEERSTSISPSPPNNTTPTSNNSNDEGEKAIELSTSPTTDTTKKTTTTELKPSKNKTKSPPALELPTLNRNQLIRLFRCFLSSISTCIHHNDDTDTTGRQREEEEEERSRKVAKGGKCDSPSSAVARKISMESPPPITTATNNDINTTAIDDDKSSPSLITSSGMKLEEVGSSLDDESMSTSPHPISTKSSSPPSSQTPKDWTLSSETEHEIREIANYATDRIIEYVRTKKFTPSPSSSSSTTPPPKRPSSPTSSPSLVSIDFSVFGDWYNSGGFSLVPWLELLDLAKWDYAGRAAAAAAAAAVGISKHSTGRGGRSGMNGGGREYSSPNAMMDPIMEEGGGGGVGGEGGGEFGGGGKVERREPQSCGMGGGRFDSGGGGGLEVDGGTNLFFNSPRSIKPKVAVASRTLISFDFGSTGGASGGGSNGNNERQPPQRSGSSARHSIDITADNLSMLQNLVTRTSLCKCTPEHVAKVLLRHSKRRRIPVSASSSPQEVMMVLSRQDFGRCIRDLVPPEASRAFSDVEMETFSNFFTNFFLCFGRINSNSAVGLDIEHVNVRELIVGFSFLCKGNKSAKLGTIFEVIEEQNAGFLSQRKLMRYLRSYLTMLVGISLLSPSAKSTTETRRALLAVEQSIGFYDSLFAAAESGARWTLDHFLRGHEAKMKKSGGGGRNANNGMISFEDFASWYTEEGGYKIAPWLEFLDLKKFLSLLTDDTTHQQQEKLHSRSTNTNTTTATTATTARGNGNGSTVSQPPSDRITRTFDENSTTTTNNKSIPTKNKAPTTRPIRPAPSRPIHAPYPPAPSADVLFTFPLANRHSLVVLRADAAYVRTVVNQLGLLSKPPEEVWTGLYRHVQDSPPPPLAWRYAQHHNSGTGKSLDVDQATFVTALEGVVQKVVKRKRPVDNKSSSSAKDTLTNFFQSFDLDQVDRVAANQLMGGLTLLCGGKKSAKLAFSFGLFDGRTKEEKKGKDNQSLRGKELFYFLRSFLIVMFSCCKQSLDLSADAVGRYISDTANMVTDDVMKYLWRERRSERVDFEQFGEWYNEGGFETAPWLELLDLNKWVLLDEAKGKKNTGSTATTAAGTKINSKERVAPRRPHLRETNIKVNTIKVKKEKEVMETTSNKPEIVAETKDILSEPISECPPPPPDDILDPTSDMFFDDMGMDDIDFLFHDSSGKDKENIDTAPNIDSVGISDPSILSKIDGDSVVGEHKAELEQQSKSSTESKPLIFHLLTSDNQSGYTISITPRRVRLLKHLITESDLFNVNITAACEKILAEAIDGKLKKDMFDAAMRKVIALSDTGGAKMTTDTQRLLSDLLSSVYSAFDLNKAGEVDARELACGFTVLCGGRKSDKLEYAFELLDVKKSGLFSRADMVLYLQSFLTVLLSISSCAIGRESSEDILGSLNGTTSSVSRVIGWGSSWATEQVFKSTPLDQKVIKGEIELINFDSFADWYTKGGFTSIQWLELLDLRKWVLADFL